MSRWQDCTDHQLALIFFFHFLVPVIPRDLGWFWGEEEVDEDVAKHIFPSLLNFDYFHGSVQITACCKRSFFDLGLKQLSTCPVSKINVGGSTLGPLTSTIMEFWFGLQYQTLYPSWSKNLNYNTKAVSYPITMVPLVISWLEGQNNRMLDSVLGKTIHIFSSPAAPCHPLKTSPSEDVSWLIWNWFLYVLTTMCVLYTAIRSFHVVRVGNQG